MDYKEIRTFRDGTVMVSLDGQDHIVTREMCEIIKRKRYVPIAVSMLRDKFPAYEIDCVDDGLTITVSKPDGDEAGLYTFGETDALDEIYGRVFDGIANLEYQVCISNYEYFLKNYINK